MSDTKPVTLLNADFIQKLRQIYKLQFEIRKHTLHLNVQKSEAYLQTCKTSTTEFFDPLTAFNR